MQTKFLFILLQLHCLLFFTNGHSSYKYRNRNRSRGSPHGAHNAQALVLADGLPASSAAASTAAAAGGPNQPPTQQRHQPQIECDFLSHKETGCEDEIGSRCDPNTSKCTCKDSHPVRLLDFCLKVSRLNGPCYTSGQCAGIANASCYIFGKEYDVETSSGFHNVGPHLRYWPIGQCKCKIGFAYNLELKICQKSLIGSWCSLDKHCWSMRSLNAICDKKRGECECAWGTSYNKELDTCVPDTSGAAGANGAPNGHHRQIYMSKCEQDSDCSPAGAIQPSGTPSSSFSSSSSSPSSTHPPASVAHPTVASTSSSSVATSSPKPPPASSTASSSLVHEPSAQIENQHLMLEQADQENGNGPFVPVRYLHGHRRLKDGLKRLTNYHLREMQCIRGRCMCPSLHSTFDGHMHCKEYEVQTNSSHRHNRKNHNNFSDLDDELNDEFDEDGSSVTWQTIFLMALGSSLLAGFIFRFCYYRKCEDDDELSEGLRSPDGLYAHKTALGREHPFFNPVTVAFLSKPNPSVMNGASCGSHFDPAYGYIASAPSCYHEYDYGYGMCNAGAPTAPPHSMAPNGAMMRGHLHQPSASGGSTLGKPPNEADEDAYLEQNPEERENFEKKEPTDHLEALANGCVQCGQIRNGALAYPPPPAELQTASQCCGCDCSSLAPTTTEANSSTLTRAILEQYAIGGTVTPATTTTTGGRTSSSGNTTTNEDDEEKEALSNESKSDFIESDLKDEEKEHLELTSLSTSLHTTFGAKPSSDLGSEDSIEETSDEHIAILNRKPARKEKWRSSAAGSSAETSINGAATSSALDRSPSSAGS